MENSSNCSADFSHFQVMLQMNFLGKILDSRVTLTSDLLKVRGRGQDQRLRGFDQEAA